jgi:dolichyl-phosphate beta-glucosyltransferase
MTEARGEFRLFMDADNSTTLNQVGRFWPWIEKGYDIVIGSRSIKGSDIVQRQPYYKELAGRFGNLLIRALAVPGISDTQAGFKLFNRRSAETVFPRITIERWGYDVEALAIARVLGLGIREVPIRWVNAPGSKVTLRSYFQVFHEVWSIRKNLKAGKYR